MHVKHPTDGARPHGCRPSDVELEAIGGHQCDIRRSGSVASSHDNAQDVRPRCEEGPVRLECVGSGAVGILPERASTLPTRTGEAPAGHRISDKARRQPGCHHPPCCSFGEHGGPLDYILQDSQKYLLDSPMSYSAAKICPKLLDRVYATICGGESGPGPTASAK